MLGVRGITSATHRLMNAPSIDIRPACQSKARLTVRQLLGRLIALGKGHTGFQIKNRPPLRALNPLPPQGLGGAVDEKSVPAETRVALGRCIRQLKNLWQAGSFVCWLGQGGGAGLQGSLQTMLGA